MSVKERRAWDDAEGAYRRHVQEHGYPRDGRSTWCLAWAAALVESEARERELERTKERLREAQDESQRWADRWARLENRPLIEVAEERAAKAEAREAVLVEALRKAEADFEWIVAHDPESGSAALARQGRNAIRGSLAGVVEAESCPHEWVDARNEAIQSGEWCPKCLAIRAEAEPDGSERA